MWQIASALVVDDDPNTLAGIGLMLRRLQVRYVTGAGSVDEALGALDLLRVDIVISDLNMDPLDGMALLRALRANRDWRNIPFLMMTAEASLDAWRTAIEAGVDEFIRKPFSQGDLEAAIGVALSARGPAPASCARLRQTAWP